MQVPIRRVQIGGENWELRGDMESGYAYAELTGGGLEDAYERLRPLFRLVELPQELARLDPADTDYADATERLSAEYRELSRTQNDPRPWVDLLWAFSAGYRSESGWDDQHWVPGDAALHPADRHGFRCFKRLLTPYQLRPLKDRILSLYTASTAPPTTTGAGMAASAAPVINPEANGSPMTGDGRTT